MRENFETVQLSLNGLFFCKFTLLNGVEIIVEMYC